MTLLLAGDIGGTKTILQLVELVPSAESGALSLKTRYEARYNSQEFTDLVPMVRQFWAEAEAQNGQFPSPQKACFAIAGPVIDNTSSLTNLSWSLDGDRLSEELEIAQVALINDFSAVGFGVLGLAPSDIHTLQAGKLRINSPIAVIGAGTGLGQGFLIQHGSRYEIYPSEGGHADFAPRSELEFQLLKYLLEKFQINRISVERVVSGQGIVAIYQFLRDRQIARETPEVGDLIRQWEREIGKPEKSVDPGAVIAQAAAADQDTLSSEAMQLFVSAYGAEAGNLALKLLPYGGLYVAGGIAAKNLALMQSGKFLEAFIDKGRMRSLLIDIPVHIVLNPQVGLIGAALYASKL